MPKSDTGLFALLREDIECVFERDPAARSHIEIFLTYPGVHAILWHRLSHWFWGRGLRFCARLTSFFSRFLTNIDIHPGATIGRRFFIDHGAGVVIGETAEVGDDVTIYHGVTLGGTSWNKGKRHPTLSDGVVVGGGAKILGPIVVGEGAKVGANSVVIQDVPAGRTVVDIPGRIVQTISKRKLNPYGVDLNHHEIADPVADAISCLMERIRVLEARLGLEAAETRDNCSGCEDPACINDLCEEDYPVKLRASS